VMRQWLVPFRARGDGLFDGQDPIGPGGMVFSGDRDGDGTPDLVVVRYDDEDGFVSTVSVTANHTPRGPTSVLSIQGTAEVGSGWVKLAWYAADRAVARARVMRRFEEGDWMAIGEAVFDGAGHASFVDRDLAPGRYAYRLDGAGSPSDVVSVIVPESGALRLIGVRPQPAYGPLSVAFELPRAGAARIAMFDVAGRRVLERRWAALAAGAHVEALGARLAPGVYTLRLEHAGESRACRAVVLR